MIKINTEKWLIKTSYTMQMLAQLLISGNQISNFENILKIKSLLDFTYNINISGKTYFFLTIENDFVIVMTGYF